MANLYINLSVADLPKATAFYEAIGFIKNNDFSNKDASAMVYDDTLSVMLLTHAFMKNFLPSHKTVADSHKSCEVLTALQMNTKEAVDALYEKAIAAWAVATIPSYDHGFMYWKDFEDIDGHIWEVFWMQPQGL